MNCDEVLYPPFVSWEVTNYCNHKCRYCYNYNVKQPENRDFDNAEISEIADFIIDHKPLGVSISGGEPLLFFDEIKKYIQKFCDNGIFVSVYTNGSVITKEMASFFTSNNIRLMVSFPSVIEREFTDIVNNKFTYKSVINSLNLLFEHRVNFQPNIVVTKLNSGSINETVEFLADKYSVKKVFISRATRPSNADKKYDDIQLSSIELNRVYNDCVKLAGKHNIEMGACGGSAICAFEHSKSRKMFSKVCSFGVDGYTITSTGDVRICSRDSKVYGNIFADEFSKIRHGMCKWKEAMLPKECNGCRFKEVCRGGCRLAKNNCESDKKSIDCDANPKILNKKKHSVKIPLFNPFRSFSVKEISVVEDKTMCRVSWFLKYVYVEKTIADFLLAKKRFNYLTFLYAYRFKIRNANTILRQLLKSGIVR